MVQLDPELNSALQCINKEESSRSLSSATITVVVMLALPPLPRDAMEESLGICSYSLSDVEGFDAVFKACFSDFVVHKVDELGEVARLTCQKLHCIGCRSDG